MSSSFFSHRSQKLLISPSYAHYELDIKDVRDPCISIFMPVQDKRGNLRGLEAGSYECGLRNRHRWLSFQPCQLNKDLVWD